MKCSSCNGEVVIWKKINDYNMECYCKVCKKAWYYDGRLLKNEYGEPDFKIDYSEKPKLELS